MYHHNGSRSAGRAVTTVELEGDLTYRSITTVCTQVGSRLQSERLGVVLDMDGVTSLSHGALGWLLRLHTEAEQCGSDVVFAGVQPAVYETLEAGGFVDVFKVFESANLARASLGDATAIS